MKETWIPWSSQGMTYFCAFSMNRQLTHIIATQPLDRGIQKTLDCPVKPDNDKLFKTSVVVYSRGNWYVKDAG